MHLDNIMISIDFFLKKIQELAKLELQEKWDNSGIQILVKKEIKKILLSLDITLDTINFAIKNNIDLIFSHHPLFFNPVRNIDFNDAKSQIIIKAINNKINIISFHTNIDIASEGLADYFCKRLNITKYYPLKEKKQNYYKIVTFIPENKVEIFINFLKKNKLSQINNYYACSFLNRGIGTFYGNELSNPFIGKKNKLEKVSEYKFEFLVNNDDKLDVIKMIRDIHPYEEPLIELYKLNYPNNIVGGLGRVGEFDKKYTLKELLNKVKKSFPVERIKYTPIRKKYFKKVAICPGSGMSLINEVVKRKVDVFITGDIKYHEAFIGEENNILLIDIGHFASEIIFLDFFEEIINKRFKVDVIKYKQKDIFKYF